MNLPQAVFFDLDGTLLDTAPDFHTAINQVLAGEQRNPVDLHTLRAWVTNGSDGIIRATFDIDDAHPDFKRLKLALLEAYLDCLTEQTRLFPGLEPSLDFLRSQAIPWGVVTNKPVKYAQPVMDALLPQCAVLVCPDHVQQTKPHPEGLQIAANKVNAPPELCLYVGDHARDIQAGRAAGMKTVAAEWGYIDPQLEQPDAWGADFRIRQPDELLNILQTAFKI